MPHQSPPSPPHNSSRIHGAITLNNFIAVEPGPSSSLSNSLFLRGLRWSTVSHLSVVSFISGSTVTPGETRIRRLARPRPSFTCTGADILAHFVEADFLYSPCGPDQYMALSISNWVSMEVMRAELSAFQRALEAMLSTEPAVGIFGE
jgi:hypothetical protein